MGESSNATLNGQIACFQKHEWILGKPKLVYLYMPLSFPTPSQGINEVDTTCPVCRKPMRIAINSRGQAAAKWWAILLGAIVVLPVASVGFCWLAISDTVDDKFSTNMMWFFGIGSLVNALWLAPYALFRARNPKFLDHMEIVSGSGNVVGHIGSGQPVPMHVHIVCN